MSNIIDLSLLTQEPLILKFAEDNQFTIPPEPSVHLVNQLLDFEDKALKAKTNKAQFGSFVKMVTLILSQDESKDVTEEFVEKNVSVSQMRRIVQIYQSKVVENAESKN
ncbi:hypothetical protein [Halalkalibacter krulwichiae]|uniref:Phage XkdN-like protein n=1 Tax=Halalkalibacter krulwichiae TaxID=199441 RepID=A0A1X9MBK0_9BACI|nr:hypothetical protein [Halalkalibacter krulwichiae]ARK30768.1 hypothetical protein BkAM31D_13505 [Halalkalibacter krulwichiae]